MKKWKTDFRNSLQFLSRPKRGGSGRDRGCPPAPEEEKKWGVPINVDRRREKGKENYSPGDNKDQLEEGVAAQPLPRRWKKKASGGNEGGIPKGEEKRRGAKDGSRRWEEARGRGELEGQKLESKRKCFEAVLLEG